MLILAAKEYILKTYRKSAKVRVSDESQLWYLFIFFIIQLRRHPHKKQISVINASAHTP